MEVLRGRSRGGTVPLNGVGLAPRGITIAFKDLGAEEKTAVRDLRRQKDLGIVEDRFPVAGIPRGVVPAGSSVFIAEFPDHLGGGFTAGPLGGFPALIGRDEDGESPVRGHEDRRVVHTVAAVVGQNRSVPGIAR